MILGDHVCSPACIKRRKAPTNGTPQDKTGIELLIARYNWLEAVQAYRATIAATNEESDELIRVHYAEQDKKIVAQPAARAPKSVTDIFGTHIVDKYANQASL